MRTSRFGVGEKPSKQGGGASGSKEGGDTKEGKLTVKFKASSAKATPNSDF
jgi:hypothetical protein